MALAGGVETAHQAIEEHFTEEYREAVLAEIEECRKHGLRTGSPQELHDAKANLKYIRDELGLFKERLEGIRKEWKASPLASLELTLQPDNDQQRLLFYQLKKRAPQSIIEVTGKTSCLFEFSWLEERFAKDSAAIDSLLKAAGAAERQIASGEAPASNLETRTPDAIAASREPLSIEKKRRIWKERALTVSEIGYSETTKRVVMTLWTLYKLINTFSSDYQKIQQLKARLPVTAVSTFTSGFVKQKMNSVMDCVVQSGNAKMSRSGTKNNTRSLPDS